MGFRDDEDALRRKAQRLEEELAEARAALEQKDRELATERARRDGPATRAGARRRRSPSLFVGLGMAAAGLVAVGVVAIVVTEEASGPGARSESFPARVRRVVGEAPVAAGASCTVDLSVAYGERPSPLVPQEGCRLWIGESIGGNDPSGRVELLACGEGSLEGETQWSSLVAGWSRRALSGRDEGGVLALAESAVVESHPRPGWGFCPVSAYALTRSADGGLHGTFRSEACDDEGDLALSPVTRGPDAPRASGTRWECSVRVRCDEALIYGARRPEGITECVVHEDARALERAIDSSDDDGDPRLDFDFEARAVSVTTASWSVDLELRPDGT